MKKFTKTCLITAGIMLVSGFIICIVCGLIAGPQLRNPNSEFWANMPDKLQIDYTPFSRTHSFSSHNDDFVIRNNFHDVFYDDIAIYDNSHSNQQVAKAKEINDLDFDINCGAVILEKSNDEYFHIDYKGNGHLQYFVKDHTLFIVGFYKPGEIKNHTKDKLILSIPEKQKFNNMTIRCDAGSIESDDIVTESLHMEIDAASVCMKQLTASSVNMNGNAASMEFSDASVRDLSLEMNAGAIAYKGEILSSASVDVNAGSGEFILNGNEKNFNYELDCAMGGISINGKDYAGLGYVKGLDYDADADFRISCSMGSVDLSFR